MPSTTWISKQSSITCIENKDSFRVLVFLFGTDAGVSWHKQKFQENLSSSWNPLYPLNDYERVDTWIRTKDPHHVKVIL